MPKLFSLSLVALSALAFAGDPFDFHVSDIRLLTTKEVRDDLKVTQAQRDKMNRHAKAFDGQMASMKGAPENEASAKKMMGFEKTLKEKVLAELTSNQVKRLREITLQSVGILSFLDDKVAERCGLPTANVRRLQGIMVQARESFEKSRMGILQKNEPLVKRLTGAAREKKVKEVGDQINGEYVRIFTDARQKLSAAIPEASKKKLMELEGKRFNPKS